MSKKACFKCGEVKLLDEYYKHSQMADGHLNKCKSCTKSDSTKHRNDNLQRVRQYDRNRPNKKYRSARQMDYAKTEKGVIVRKKATENYIEKFPVRRKANIAVGNAVRDGRLIKPSNCSKCGVECRPHGHHDDYSYFLSVRWLCVSCHSDFHATVRQLARNLAHLIDPEKYLLYC